MKYDSKPEVINKHRKLLAALGRHHRPVSNSAILVVQLVVVLLIAITIGPEVASATASTSSSSSSQSNMDCRRCFHQCALAYRDSLAERICSRCLATCNEKSLMTSSFRSSLVSFFREHRCCSVDSESERFHDLLRALLGLHASSPATEGSLRNTGYSYQNILNRGPHQKQCLVGGKVRDDVTALLRTKQALVSRCMELMMNERINIGSTTQQESEEEMQDLVEKIMGQDYKDRFIDSRGVEELERNLAEEDRNPETRNGGGYHMGFGMRLCQVKRKVTRPLMAEHHSGVRVPLLIRSSTRQYFFETSCESEIPLLNTNPPGKCKDVKGMHKALFIIDDFKYQRHKSKFTGCKILNPKSKGLKRYLCDDWIKLRGSCALYV